MQYGELMTEVLREIFPGGFPSDADVAKMTKSQKEILYEKQKLVINTFRTRAEAKVHELQDILQSIPRVPIPVHEPPPLIKSQETKSCEIFQIQPENPPAFRSASDLPRVNQLSKDAKSCDLPSLQPRKEVINQRKSVDVTNKELPKIHFPRSRLPLFESPATIAKQMTQTPKLKIKEPKNKKPPFHN